MCENILKELFHLKKSDRNWHLPLLEGITVGTPILAGWYFNRFEEGKLISISGLTIVYLQSKKFSENAISLMASCFLIITSFSIGLIFSFNPVVATFMFGLFIGCANFTLYRLNLDSPPGIFFYAMIASIGICLPFNLPQIPEKVGLITLGTIFTFVVGFLYALITNKTKDKLHLTLIYKDQHQKIVESTFLGFFISISIGLAFFLNLDNPYWVPISCCAVMQGRSTRHIMIRSIHRMSGTIAGIVITWLLLLLNPSLFVIAMSIIISQIFIEYLVVRNYGLANIFITILTILLAEKSYNLLNDSIFSFSNRFLDILLGSFIGIIGGTILYSNFLNRYISKYNN